VAVCPEFQFFGFNHGGFFGTGVVVAQDREDAGIFIAQFFFYFLEFFCQESPDKIFMEGFTSSHGGVGGGQEVAADKECVRLFGADSIEEFSVSFAAAVQVGDEKTVQRLSGNCCPPF
jgi:hypothetical protein